MSTRTLLGLEIVTQGNDPIPQMKVLAFLDYMRKEAAARLGIPEQFINAETRSTPIVNRDSHVPEGRPSGSPVSPTAGNPQKDLPITIS